MQNISLYVEIPFMPEPKGRPRFTRAGRTYTPAKTKKSESKLMHFIAQKWEGMEPLDGAVFVEIEFHIKRPKSVKAKKRPHPVVRPDLDNYAKTILDAITKARVWVDDSQVCKLVLSKYYTENESFCTLKVASL